MYFRKNRRENLIVEKYQEQGYEVITKGYPDLLCLKDGKIKFVEVKRSQLKTTRKMGLSSHQRRVHEILRENGFEVEVVYVD